jgi:hypothetical protein
VRYHFVSAGRGLEMRSPEDDNMAKGNNSRKKETKKPKKDKK